MGDAAPETITHKRILKIAVPIVLANVTVPLLGLVDTGVVGQLGQAAPIGAVGIGAVILTSIYWVFGFLRMGTTGLTSQAYGAGNSDEVRALLLRGLMIGGAAGLLMILLQMPIIWAAFKLSPASAEVEAMARSYLSIRVFSAPAAIALYGVTGWLIALERTRAVLILQIWMNGLNIALDFWFVLGLGWGVQGVATATFLAEWSGLVFGLWLCIRYLPGGLKFDVARVFDPVRLRRMAVVNGDIMLRSILMLAAFTSFLFFGAGLGDVTLAANQVLLEFLHVVAFALDGFAFAAETLVGQALGAGSRLSIRRSAILTSGWGLVLVILMAAGFALFGERIIAIMTTAPDVRVAAGGYLFWMVMAPLVGIASWMFDGIFIGATHTREMRNGMLISFVVYCGAVWFLLPAFGNHGLWASLMIFNATRGLTLALWYPKLEAAATAR
mgnify:CR=1 FL=1